MYEKEKQGCGGSSGEEGTHIPVLTQRQPVSEAMGITQKVPVAQPESVGGQL